MRRAVTYLVGGALVAYGCWLLLSTRALEGLVPVVRWGVGGLVAHDAVAVPLALLVGVVVSRFLPGVLRAPVQAGLFVSAAVTLAAVPFVLGYGRKPDNPSLLPLPYGRNLLLLLAVVWAVVAVAALVRILRRRLVRRVGGE